jgi:hypothetical protein
VLDGVTKQGGLCLWIEEEDPPCQEVKALCPPIRVTKLDGLCLWIEEEDTPCEEVKSHV